MNSKNKLIFLAGSTGMAGSSILEHIIKYYPGYRIKAAYHRNAEFLIKNKKVEYVRGDLRVLEDCRRMVRGCGYAVMAAANTSGSAILTSEPWQQVSDNILMNTQMLEAFHREKVKRAVYIGSATLYQEHKGFIREDQLDLNKPPHQAYSGIGNVVRFIEKLCEFWHTRAGMEIIILRAANIYGPYARFNPRTSNFIPAIIRKAVAKIEPFEVWGSPEVTRDVIYSEDFAAAVLAALNKEKVKFDVFNIGSQQKTKVSQVVRLALKYAGYNPGRIQYDERKPATSLFRALDCSKARSCLGWKPEFTLEDGIKNTTEWWIQNKGWWKR
jgi:nucleoside-diphosphate-sugar epimerase